MTDEKVRWVSPNQIHKAAKEMMLDGREPKTEEDWCLCVNFWASNVANSQVEVCILLSKLFDCPLSREYVVEIAEYQARKAG